MKAGVDSSEIQHFSPKPEIHCVRLTDVSKRGPSWVSGTVGFSPSVNGWAAEGAEPPRKTIPIFLQRESGSHFHQFFQGVPILQKFVYPRIFSLLETIPGSLS